jgi:dTMP kinase
MMIAITGCDGAGKSTIVAEVVAWLRASGRDVELIDKWDIMDRDRFPECRFIGVPLRELRSCVSSMDGIAQALFLFWAISITVEKRDLNVPGRIYILDSYWMKHAAVETVYGADRDWVERTIAEFPPTDLTIYLDVIPEDALARKHDFVSYECGRDPECRPESFLAHQTKTRALLQQWAERYGWKTIDVSRTLDQVRADVFDEVRNAVDAPPTPRAC